MLFALTRPPHVNVDELVVKALRAVEPRPDPCASTDGPDDPRGLDLLHLRRAGRHRGETQGLFADDTRFLSRLCLTVNGAAPLLLSSGKVEYFSAAFFLRNPLAGGLPQDSLSIIRHRFVGDGMQDHVIVENQSMEPVAFELALELGTDFADILSVKARDFALGDPSRADPLPEPVAAEVRGGAQPVRARGARRRGRREDAGDPLSAR